MESRVKVDKKYTFTLIDKYFDERKIEVRSNNISTFTVDVEHQDIAKSKEGYQNLISIIESGIWPRPSSKTQLTKTIVRLYSFPNCKISLCFEYRENVKHITFYEGRKNTKECEFDSNISFEYYIPYEECDLSSLLTVLKAIIIFGSEEIVYPVTEAGPGKTDTSDDEDENN